MEIPSEGWHNEPRGWRLLVPEGERWRRVVIPQMTINCYQRWFIKMNTVTEQIFINVYFLCKMCDGTQIVKKRTAGTWLLMPAMTSTIFIDLNIFCICRGSGTAYFEWLRMKFLEEELTFLHENFDQIVWYIFEFADSKVKSVHSWKKQYQVWNQIIDRK